MPPVYALTAVEGLLVLIHGAVHFVKQFTEPVGAQLGGTHGNRHRAGAFPGGVVGVQSRLNAVLDRLQVGKGGILHQDDELIAAIPGHDGPGAGSLL